MNRLKPSTPGEKEIRREKSMNKDFINADLTEACGCSKKSHEELTTVIVFIWRQKYHRVEGRQKFTKLLELYSMTVHRGNHLIEGKEICQ